MWSQALEHIIEEVNTLTPGNSSHASRKDERTADLRRIQGKYAGMKTGSDAFAARKTEKIELEDRRRR